MRGTLALLLLLALTAAALDVAIIGAGIGGGAAAYFAHETLGPDTRITVFEKEDRVGGRVHDVTIGGLRVEAGASIYHKVNLYVHNFTRLFNLTTAVAGGGGSSGGHMGIWNGREMVFEESDLSLVTIAKLLWRYHLSPVKLRSLTNAVLEKWQGVYDLFNQGVAFDSVQEWLDRLNLTDLIRVDLKTHLIAAGCSESFVSELITAVTRVQYGQDASLHALVGLVSLVGAEDGNLLYLPGGNDQIVSALLAHAKATVMLSTPVHTVARVGSCRYRIDAHGEFDAVLLAMPLEESGLHFVGFDDALDRPADRAFRTTHATFVKANSLNEQYFAPASLGAVDQILTTEGLPFNSIAHKGVADDGQRVYKVFSRTPLTQELRSALFLNGTVAATFPWRAYPLLTPFADAKSAPPSFLLAPSLVYLNAFESAISCMETSVLAARNAVNLVAKQTLARLD